MQLVVALALTVVLRAGPDAPAPARPSVEAELEAQLAATTPTLPPAEVLVVVDGPDPKRYRLEQATLRLDGAPVTAVTAAAAAATTDGKPPAGTAVSDGDHVFTGQLVYRGQALGPHPWEEGPKWTLPTRLSLKASRGLRLVVRLTVEVNDRAPVPAQRLSLRSELEPQMLAAVDDAPLPPPPLPNLPPPAAVAAPPAPSPDTVSSPPPRAAVAAPAKSSAPKKKQAKKAARAAPGATAAAAAGKGSPDTTESLEEASARLRAALSAPHDGGTPSAAEKPR